MSLLEWLKFWSKFYRIPLFWNTVSEYLPPPENWNLGRSWHFDFSVSEYPPRKLKFRQTLVLWLFSFRIPPPPRKLKFRQILALWLISFRIPPPRKLKFRQILALWLFSFRIPPSPKNWNLGRSWHFDFSVSEYPPFPENWNLGRSWYFDFSVSEYPPPPGKLKFRQILAL